MPGTVALRDLVKEHLPVELLRAVFAVDPLQTKRALEGTNFFMENQGATVGEFRVRVQQIVDQVLLYCKRKTETGIAITQPKHIKQILAENAATEEDDDSFFFPDPNAESLVDGLAALELENDVSKLANGLAAMELKKARKEAAAAESTEVVSGHVRWRPRCREPEDHERLSADRHGWYCTLYLRTEIGDALLYALSLSKSNRPERLDRRRRWAKAHVPLLHYADECELVDLDPVQVARLYCPLGPSWYQDSVDLIEMRHFYVENKPTPDVTLAEHGCAFPEPVERAAQRIHAAFEGDEPGPEARRIWEQLQRQDHWFYPKRLLRPEQVGSHSLYAAMVLRLDTLSNVRRVNRDASGAPGPVADAAYLYQLAFLDLMVSCEQAGRWDDEFMLSVLPQKGMSTFELAYPFPDRAFQWGDLPDLFIVLCRDIMLFGDRIEFSYPLGNIMQKCMPYASQRRMMFDRIKPAAEDPGFWKVFRLVMWCTFAGVYPGCKERPDGAKALFLYRLCADKERFLAALAPVKREKQSSRSCTIVYTAFRIYMAHMVADNPGFRYASPSPNWKAMLDNSRQMAQLVRASHVYAQDVFKDARIRLDRHNKNAKAHVYRYRSHALARKLYDVCSTTLTKLVFLEIEILRGLLHQVRECLLALERGEDPQASFSELLRTRLRKELSACDPSHSHQLSQALQNTQLLLELRLREYSRDISLDAKNAILNLVVDLPAHLCYDIRTLYLLTLERFGAVEPATCRGMVKLAQINLNAGFPGKSNKVLDRLTAYDLRVVSWYWFCVKLMDNYKVAPLPARVVAATEAAMKKRRFALYPGLQELKDHAWTVCVSLCCRQVLCEKDNSIGTDKVKFHESLHDIVCEREKTLTSCDLSQPTTSSAEQKKRARYMKQAFFWIPCHEQPVLRINLRGKLLIHKSNRSSQERYMRCPQCAGFHKVVNDCWLSGDYACPSCTQRNAVVAKRWSCAYCREPVPPIWRKPAGSKKPEWLPPESFVQVHRPTVGSDPQDPDWDPAQDPPGATQVLCFCQKHWKAARNRAKRVDKRHLWQIIGERTVNKQIEYSRKYG